MAVPDSITGLVSWLKADAITGLSDGNNVTTWQDSSAANNDAVSGEVNHPLYQTNVLNSLPIVDFINGTPSPVMNVGAANGLTLPNPFTVFYVGRLTGTQGNRRAITSTTENWLLGPYSSAWQWFSGGFATAGPAVVIGTWIIHAVIQTAGTGTHYVWTIDTAAAPFSAARANPTQLAAPRLSGGVIGEPYQGEFAEVIFYNTNVSNTDRDALAQYLRVKWGGLTPPAPTAPSNLVATTISTTSIGLTWDDNSADETSFRVERSLTGVGGWSTAGTPAADAETFTDTGRTCGTQYFYRVFAVNGAGDSTASNTDDATTTACPPSAGGGRRMGGSGAILKPPRGGR